MSGRTPTDAHPKEFSRLQNEPLGVLSSQRQILCRSYTRLPARCSNMPTNYPTRILAGPSHCPQCQTKHPLTAHGFYTRTLIDSAFDGIIRVRRYVVPSLPAHRVPAARVRFAVPAHQPDGDRAVSRHATPPGANTERCSRNRCATSAASSGCAARACKVKRCA